MQPQVNSLVLAGIMFSAVTAESSISFMVLADAGGGDLESASQTRDT